MALMGYPGKFKSQCKSQMFTDANLYTSLNWYVCHTIKKDHLIRICCFSFGYLGMTQTKIYFCICTFPQTIPACPKGTKYTVRTTWSGATYGICAEKPKKSSEEKKPASAGRSL